MHQLPDNTLLIEKVKREDAGTYECRAKIRGRPIYKLLSVSVVVNGQYLFTSRLNEIARGLKNLIWLGTLIDQHFLKIILTSLKCKRSIHLPKHIPSCFMFSVGSVLYLFFG